MLFAEIINLTENSQIKYVPGFITPNAADELVSGINQRLEFTRPSIVMFGKWSRLPREVAWIAGDDQTYAYSGVSTNPIPWPDFLLPVRQLVETESGVGFNSVLVNHYRDGSDSVAWHSDDEPELGPAPTIASLSLGATRRFLLRNKRTNETIELELAHGDLLVMLGHCQNEFTHCVPRTRKVVARRLNLTFRNLITIKSVGANQK